MTAVNRMIRGSFSCQPFGRVKTIPYGVVSTLHKVVGNDAYIVPKRFYQMLFSAVNILYP